LLEQVRIAAGRPAPVATVIGSYSVTAVHTEPKTCRGRDSTRNADGHQGHIAVDTIGLVLAVVIAATSV
jgi:hypothetical protein